MIWLDITDPKYVLFFKELIPLLENLDKLIITSRTSKDYSECARLLKLFNIPHTHIGSYGGSDKLSKLESRLTRQKAFLELFNKIGIPKLFICGASVEGVHAAYGLGIPIIIFADTPLKSHRFSIKDITILSRLTLPLANIIFRPFVVPSQCYTALGLKKSQVIAYNFLDVALWLKNMPNGSDFRKKLNIPTDIPTILVREEEYKAHYVKKQLPIIYESISLLAELEVSVVIMPRYESTHLKKNFANKKNIYILEQILPPQDFYPFIDVLVGGGGTMNLESCYLGIPTISTRSLFLFHDRYLIDNNLMYHCVDSRSVLDLVISILKNKRKKRIQKELFEIEEANFTNIFNKIKNFYKTTCEAL